MKGSKLFASSVLAACVCAAVGGSANAQSIGAGITQPVAKPRSEMGQTTTGQPLTGQTPAPGATAMDPSMSTTDPSMAPTTPRMNPTPDTSMQRMDGSSPGSRNSGMNGTDVDAGTSSGTSPSPGSTSMGMPAGQGGMSDSSGAPLRERRPKLDRN